VTRRPAASLARLALAATLPAAGGAQAQTLYVIEQLVVNVNSAPDASGERVATLKSGDPVELLERSGDAAHVRLASGQDGWLRGSYLSAEQPLAVRLAAREREVAQLQEDLGQARARLTAGAARQASPAATVPAEDTSTRAAPLFTPAIEPSRAAWPWALAGALLGLATGFALGVLLLDRHIRRKFGGLRIY
jgi:SH3-like domain-containing protein